VRTFISKTTGVIQHFPIPSGSEWIEVKEPAPSPRHSLSIEYGAAVWVEKQPEYRKLASLEFLELFAPERRAIKAAAMSDVDIGIWYDDTVAAQFVTYSDPRVEAGLTALVDAGLLTPERKAEIVAAMTSQAT